MTRGRERSAQEVGEADRWLESVLTRYVRPPSLSFAAWLSKFAVYQGIHRFDAKNNGHPVAPKGHVLDSAFLQSLVSSHDPAVQARIRHARTEHEVLRLWVLLPAEQVGKRRDHIADRYGATISRLWELAVTANAPAERDAETGCIVVCRFDGQGDRGDLGTGISAAQAIKDLNALTAKLDEQQRPVEEALELYLHRLPSIKFDGKDERRQFEVILSALLSRLDKRVVRYDATTETPTEDPASILRVQPIQDGYFRLEHHEQNKKRSIHLGSQLPPLSLKKRPADPRRRDD